MPSLSTPSAPLFTNSVEINGKSQFLQSNAGIGVPQTLWRDKHHSNLFSIAAFKLLALCFGINSILSIASKALSFKFFLERLQNHWLVALKINPFLQRQQCGYE